MRRHLRRRLRSGVERTISADCLCRMLAPAPNGCLRIVYISVETQQHAVVFASSLRCSFQRLNNNRQTSSQLAKLATQSCDCAGAGDVHSERYPTWHLPYVTWQSMQQVPRKCRRVGTRRTVVVVGATPHSSGPRAVPQSTVALEALPRPGFPLPRLGGVSWH